MGGASSTENSSGLVLVVDDDDGMRESLIEILRVNDIRAVGAATAQQALAHRDAMAPDVVLVDYRLPDMSGLELARELKDDDPDLPLVLMTGTAASDAVVAGLRYLDEYLAKPARPADVVRVVRSLLERRRLVLDNRALVARLQEFGSHVTLHDPLTGLPNRALYLNRLEQSLGAARRSEASTAVMFIDIDDFKTVNDTMGHRVGDALLVAVGNRLSMAIRSGDTLARFGGDEFTIFCPDVDEAAAGAIADKLLGLFHDPVEIDGLRHVVALSIGIAIGAEHSARAEVLLRNADTAMYEAKRLGKSQWAVFDAVMRERVVHRFGTERSLRSALGRGEFRLVYQPEVHLATGRIVAAEALLRWQHPQRGELPPAAFLDVAEQTIIVPLGDELLGQAVDQLAEWMRHPDLDPEFTLWINMSPRQLAEPGLPERVERALGRHGLGPQRLGVEVTESDVVEEDGAPSRVISQLHDLGVRLAIDDFGTGYSSLAWLQRLPLDVLKIDRSFVAGLGSSARDTSIVRALVLLGHALDLTVVAEGVETVTQHAGLLEAGCDVGQGYVLGRPVPAEQFSMTGRTPVPLPRTGPPEVPPSQAVPGSAVRRPGSGPAT